MLDVETTAEVRRQAAKFQPPARNTSSSDYVGDEDENEPVDNHRNAPRPDPACLYGLVGDVARAGGDTTEANPFAIAANFLAYMACAVGRGPYMPVGNTWHHPRLFTLHVGRSGRGRKGDAVSLVTRIDQALRAINRNAAPQVHRGGLSTREGLAFMIHDAYSEGKNEVPAVLDKRLLVIESEFANILQQGKRDGNTLSSALRDCWDGVSIKPATKTNRLSATDPHVCIIAAITPGELINVMAARELTNGFANRFLMIWAERTRVIPFPVATSAEVVISLAQRVSEVLEHCKASRWGSCDHMRIELLPDARKLYEAAYLRELNDTSAGERITALLERRAPMVLRLAMLFALCDRKRDIGVAHVNAALAWVRYSIESVKFVFASGDEEADTAQTQDTAQKVFAFLQNREKATRRELTTDCWMARARATGSVIASGSL